MQVGHRLSALLQLYLHLRLDTWFQWIGQRQMQEERHFKVSKRGYRWCPSLWGDTVLYFQLYQCDAALYRSRLYLCSVKFCLSVYDSLYVQQCTIYVELFITNWSLHKKWIICPNVIPQYINIEWPPRLCLESLSIFFILNRGILKTLFDGINAQLLSLSWWRHQVETFSALPLVTGLLCANYSPVNGEFSAQRPVTRSFDIFFDLRLN